MTSAGVIPRERLGEILQHIQVVFEIVDADALFLLSGVTKLKQSTFGVVPFWVRGCQANQRIGAEREYVFLAPGTDTSFARNESRTAAP
jgi:hypothetical protein